MTKISNLYSLTNYIFADSVGNIGVGTTTPSSPLDVVASNTTAINLRLRGRSADSVGQMEFWNNAQTTRYGLIATDSTAYSIASTQAIPLVLSTNSSERMRITSAGNVGIGTTSPSQKLDIYGRTRISNPSNSAQFLEVYTDGGSVYYNAQNNSIQNTAYQHIFFTDGASPVERMRINSGGDVKFALNITFGTTSEMYIGRGNAISGAFQSYDFVMSNFQTSGRIVMTASTSGSSGMYLAQGSNSWAAWSDERLKTDLVPIDNAAEKVSQLRAMTGRYKTDDESVSRSFLIAQDVLAVLPEATDLDEATGMYAVQYTDVIPLLVASIKELSAKVTALENK